MSTAAMTTTAFEAAGDATTQMLREAASKLR